jgi:uncharacterized phage protein gp47/JayE
MPFAIPTLDDLNARARAAFIANLPGSNPYGAPNNVSASAKVIGGATNEIFGFADWVNRQKFALTADGENLDRHGAEIGLARRPAAPGVGNVQIIVADAYQIAAGALFQRADGQLYVGQSAQATNGAGTLSVPVIAQGNGITGNAIAGTPLAIVTGYTDINGDAAPLAAVDNNGITQGGDVEQDGAYYNPAPGTYRYRILFKKRYPPHGGNASDYVIWCSTIPGVTRVFVERLFAGPGTVRIFPVMDDVYAPTGIPQPGDIANIQQYLATVQPATATVVVQAPIATPINIVLNNFSPYTVTAQEAVMSELRQTFRMFSSVSGMDTPVPSMPFLATPASWLQIWLGAALVNAVGSPTADVASPVGDVVLAEGHIATLGTVTFNPPPAPQ